MKYTYDLSGNLASRSQTVAASLPKITHQPIKQIAGPGQLATFSVLVADANGVTFQWQFNGSAIPGATGDSLLLPNVTAANQGQYSVVVTNSAGSVTSEPATLMVGKSGNAADASSLKLVTYSDPGGTVTVAPMKLEYELGEPVTLTAAPVAPSTFIGWAGDLKTGDLVSTTNPVQFVMNGDKTVRARFATPLPIPSGLVAWWRAEDNVQDVTGVNHGTLDPGISFGTGKVARGLNFTGGAIKVSASKTLDVGTGDGLTIEAWIWPADLAHQYPLVEWNDGAKIGAHFWISATPQGQVSPGCLYANIMETNLTNHIIASQPGLVSTSDWQHVAVTYEKASGISRLFVNGVTVATANVGSFIPLTTADVYLGHRPGSVFYAGLMDEPTIYSRALTVNEIFDIWNTDFVGKDFTRPYFTSPSRLPDTPLNAIDTQPLTTILGTPPISFSLSAGALPPGMTLSSAGVVSGVPSMSGTFDFTIVATDAVGKTAEQLFVLRVVQPLAPPSDMVAWWRGESAPGQTVSDIIGNHTGKFFRATAAADGSYTADGKVGSAFAFDGTLYVQVPDAVELRPNAMTAEAWVFPTVQSGNHQAIIARGSTTNEDDAYWLGLFNGRPRFWSKHAGAGMLLLEAPAAIPLNQWTHVAVSFDGATKRLYVNGVPVASSGVPGVMVYEPLLPPVTIGADWGHNTSVDIFSGRLDEVSLYRRALSSDEIFNSADAGSAGKRTTRPYINSPSQLSGAIVGQAFSHTFTSILGTTPVVFALSTPTALPPELTLNPTGMLSGVPASVGRFLFVVRATDAAGSVAEQSCTLQVFASVPLPAGAVGWWRAESNAQDSAGANHGALRNGAGFSPGTVGQAFALDGTTGSVEIPDAPALRPVSLTLEAWVAFDTVLGVRVVFDKLVGTDINTSYALWLENGSLRGAVGDATARGPALSVPFSPVAGQFHHLAYTFDDGTKQQTLYLDGSLVATGTVANSIGYDGQPLLLGRGRQSAAANFFLQGRIDEATIYNRALIGSEIASIYNAGPAGKRLT